MEAGDSGGLPRPRGPGRAGVPHQATRGAAQHTDRRPDPADAAVTDLAASTIEALGLKLEKPRAKKKQDDGAPEELRKAEYLVFLSEHQLAALADLAAASTDGKVDKKEAKAAADTRHGIDVGLFGRMIADSPDLNVDAAVQVAHAISTHAVDTEFDYYTAVDDTKTAEEDAGAGMIGTVEFNSSTLYRFATIHVDGLRTNLGDDDVTAHAAAEFVRGFITSMPTGKQNTFGNRTLPDAVVVRVRHDQPVSLVGAFEEAVDLDGGFVRPSAASLAQHAEHLDTAYGQRPVRSWVLRSTDHAQSIDTMGERVTLDELIEQVRTAAGAEAREPAPDGIAGGQ